MVSLLNQAINEEKVHSVGLNSGSSTSFWTIFDSLCLSDRQEKAEKVAKVESSAAESQRRLLSRAQQELDSR